MPTLEETYDRCLGLMRDIRAVTSAAWLMEWEDATDGVPGSGRKSRSEAIGRLTKMAHGLATSDEYFDLLSSLVDEADDGNIDHVQSAVIRKAWTDCERARRLDAAFVGRLKTLQNDTRQTWEEARDRSDWNALLPGFTELVALTREKAAMLARGAEPYDALLREWEPGMTATRIDAIFRAMKPRLIALSRRIAADAPLPAAEREWFDDFRRLDLRSQRKLAGIVAASLGFDFGAGRLDESAHPFTMPIDHGDVRCTTRFVESDLFEAVGGVAHECGGHGTYSHGLPEEFHATPLWAAPAMSVDEAVAHLFQNHVARGKPFLGWLVRHLPGNADPERVFRAYNRAQQTPVRFAADPAVYDLHIMLRYDIERPLINGSLRPAEVADAWRALAEEYLGLTPSDHSVAQMQDMHWFEGAFGYFPSYSLANVYAAQLYAAMVRDLPDIETQFTAGEFRQVSGWLEPRLYRHGAMHDATETMRNAFNADPDPEYHLSWLERRYADVMRM